MSQENAEIVRSLHRAMNASDPLFQGPVLRVAEMFPKAGDGNTSRARSSYGSRWRLGQCGPPEPPGFHVRAAPSSPRAGAVRVLSASVAQGEVRQA